MCGINGVFGLEKIDDPKAMLERMNKALAHRGPDAEGYFSNDTLALSHRRLSIIDTSSAGNQPFYSNDKSIVLVFNGELYNYIELKAELNEYDFQTQSDTEVVIAAYLKWGISCLQKFNGMFAFALWDDNNSELYLVRDRIGIKPLYFSQVNEQLVFSSEIRALLESGLIKKKIDPTGLVNYIRYQTVHAPRTIIENVSMLKAGYYLKVNDNEVEVHQYWDITEKVDDKPNYQDYEAVTKNVRQLLKDSVSIRMRADVPYGAFLSGGIDSSAVVGLMSEVSDKPVNTFNISFHEEEFSEAPYAKKIAEKFDTKHTEIKLSAKEFLKLVPDALDAMDHPSADGLNTYMVSKATKEAGVTMALSGLGGDELFAGYDIFKRMITIQEKKWIMSFPKLFRKLGSKLLQAVRPSISSDKIAALLNQDYLDFEYVYPISRQSIMDEKIQKMLTLDSLPPNSTYELLSEDLAYGKKGFKLPLLSKVSFGEIGCYMQNILLRDTDQMGMAHALEVRVPFMDHKLVEYVFGVSDKMKYPTTPKKLLTDALEDLLPEEIMNRPKMGFTFPLEIWMKHEMKSFCEANIEKLSQREYFNANEIKNLWAKFLEGDKRISWSRLWTLVVLENWLEKNEID